MSRYAENLGRAARMLRRLDDIGGPSELEGVSLKEIIGDVLEAQNRAFMSEAAGRVGLQPFLCTIDESAGLAEVIDLRERIDAYSKRVS